MSEPYVTPRVRAEARRLGVPLASVTGTGAGGRIRPQDVYAAAGGSRPPVRPSAVQPAKSRRMEVASRLSPGARAVVDEGARNPLLEEAQQVVPYLHAPAARSGQPAPTLFASGDLPPFTASGVEPEALLQLPWHARHWAAAQTDRSDVLRAVEHYAEYDDDLFGEFAHQGAQDYVDRVNAWLHGARAPRPATAEDRAADAAAEAWISGLETYGR